MVLLLVDMFTPEDEMNMVMTQRFDSCGARVLHPDQGSPRAHPNSAIRGEVRFDSPARGVGLMKRDPERERAVDNHSEGGWVA
jgi:hypothetical protein